VNKYFPLVKRMRRSERSIYLYRILSTCSESFSRHTIRRTSDRTFLAGDTVRHLLHCHKVFHMVKARGSVSMKEGTEVMNLSGKMCV
jgi:hypothetical protein